VKRWLIWSTCSAVALVVTAIAFLNLLAAADLGYDAHPGGPAFIARWTYAMLGFFAVGVMCGVMAIRARWRSS
jgi:hypothetical protein